MGKAEIISADGDSLYTVSTLWRQSVGDEEISLQCIDYAETPYPELSGIVGTIEIPNEPEVQLLRPGYDGRAVFDGARDGMLAKPGTLTYLEFFYNVAMLPGWQKWVPTYRYATIQKPTWQNYLDNRLPVVLDDPNTSTQQLIDVTPNMPADGLLEVEYLACNAAAFEMDDEVVLQFFPVFGGDSIGAPTLTTTAKIIGFKANPRPDRFLVKLDYDDTEKITADSVSKPWVSAYDSNGDWVMGNVLSVAFATVGTEYFEEKIDGDGEGVWAISFWDGWVDSYSPDGFYFETYGSLSNLFTYYDEHGSRTYNWDGWESIPLIDPGCYEFTLPIAYYVSETQGLPPTDTNYRSSITKQARRYAGVAGVDDTEYTHYWEGGATLLGPDDRGVARSFYGQDELTALVYFNLGVEEEHAYHKITVVSSLPYQIERRQSNNTCFARYNFITANYDCQPLLFDCAYQADLVAAGSNTWEDMETWSYWRGRGDFIPAEIVGKIFSSSAGAVFEKEYEHNEQMTIPVGDRYVAFAATFAIGSARVPRETKLAYFLERSIPPPLGQMKWRCCAEDTGKPVRDDGFYIYSLVPNLTQSVTYGV